MLQLDEWLNGSSFKLDKLSHLKPEFLEPT
jgi:hypothetical protein